MFIKKSLSVALAVVFTWSVVARDIAYAAINPNEALQNIVLPENVYDTTFKDFAKLTASADFGGNTAVLNIQDFHMHPQVQTNISHIIDILVKQYGVKNVYVEGGYGTISTEWLSGIKDNEFKDNAISGLLNSGALTGTEYYSAINDKKDFLIGLEDEKIHKGNIKRLGEILSKKEYFEGKLDVLRDDLSFMQSKYFTSKNKRFAKLIKKHKEGKISSGKYYAQLLEYLKKNSKYSSGDYGSVVITDITQYPNMCLFLCADKLQKSLSEKRINAELTKLISGLKENLNYSEYKELLDKTDNFSNTYQLLSYLNGLSKEFKDKYFTSEISKFMDMSEKYKQINPVALITEERLLTEEIRMALSTNQAELEISFLSDFFAYFEDYLKASISADDYEYLNTRLSKFQKIWEKYAHYNRPMSDLKRELALLKQYYEVNDNRNEIFLKQIFKPGALKTDKTARVTFNEPVSKIIKGKENIIVCVTGGYHSKGLADLLASKNISYAVITPSVSGGVQTALQNYEEAALEQAGIYSQSLALSLLSINKWKDSVVINNIFNFAAQQLSGVPFSQENINILIEKLNQSLGGAVTFAYESSAEEGTAGNIVITSANLEKEQNRVFASVANENGAIKLDYVGAAIKQAQPRKISSSADFEKSFDFVAKMFGLSTMGFGKGIFVPSIYSSLESIMKFAAENHLLQGDGFIFDIAGFDVPKDQYNKIEAKLVARMPAFMQKAIKLRDEKTPEQWNAFLMAAYLLTDFIPITQDMEAMDEQYKKDRIKKRLSDASEENISSVDFLGKLYSLTRYMKAMEEDKKNLSLVARMIKQLDILRNKEAWIEGKTVEQIVAELFAAEDALTEEEKNEMLDSTLKEIKFGTAGYRKKFGTWFNYTHILINAQALAEIAKERHAASGKKTARPKIFVGYDTRFMSKEFAEIIASVLAANGVDVTLSDRNTPTPAISFILGQDASQYELGVNITASHNSYEDNGIKVNEPSGGQAGGDITSAIEKKITQIVNGEIKIRYANLEKAMQSERVAVEDKVKEKYIAGYIEMFKRQFNINNDADFERFKAKAKEIFFVVDAKNGTTPDYYEDIMKLLGIEKYKIINADFDPTFGGIDPNPDRNTELLRSEVQKMMAENPGATVYGLATDPDGDRMAVIENGETFPTDSIILYNGKMLAEKAAQIAKQTNQKQKVVFVVNLATTGSLESLMEYVNNNNEEFAGVEIEIKRTPVGFKWIAEELKEAQKYPNVLTMGAEESGAVVTGGLTLDKDGLVATFGTASLAIDSGETIADTLRKIHEMIKWVPQKDIKNIRFAQMSQLKNVRTYMESVLADNAVKNQFIKGFASLKDAYGINITDISEVRGTDFEGIFIKTDNPRVLILMRLSGTEPVVKIYAESDSEQFTQDIIDAGNQILTSINSDAKLEMPGTWEKIQDKRWVKFLGIFLIRNWTELKYWTLRCWAVAVYESKYIKTMMFNPVRFGGEMHGDVKNKDRIEAAKRLSVVTWLSAVAGLASGIAVTSAFGVFGVAAFATVFSITLAITFMGNITYHNFNNDEEIDLVLSIEANKYEEKLNSIKKRIEEAGTRETLAGIKADLEKEKEKITTIAMLRRHYKMNLERLAAEIEFFIKSIEQLADEAGKNLNKNGYYSVDLSKDDKVDLNRERPSVPLFMVNVVGRILSNDELDGYGVGRLSINIEGQKVEFSLIRQEQPQSPTSIESDNNYQETSTDTGETMLPVVRNMAVRVFLARVIYNIAGRLQVRTWAWLNRYKNISNMVEYFHLRDIETDFKIEIKQDADSDHLQIAIVTSMTENFDPENYNFKNTGRTVDGQILWISKKDGRFVVFANTEKFNDIVMTTGELIAGVPAIVERKGTNFTLSSIAIDNNIQNASASSSLINASGELVQRKFVYSESGLLIMTREYYNEILELAGGDYVVAGEMMREEQDAEKFALARSFIMDLSKMTNKENIKAAVQAFASSKNRQIAINANYFTNRKSMEDFNAEMAAAGVKVYAVFDSLNSDDAYLREGYEYGFAGYIEINNGEHIFKDFLSYDDTIKIEEIKGFTDIDGLNRQIAESLTKKERTPTIRLINLQDYVNAIEKGRDITQINELSSIFGHKIIKLFTHNRVFDVNYAVATALGFKENLIPRVDDLTPVTSREATAEGMFEEFKAFINDNTVNNDKLNDILNRTGLNKNPSFKMFLDRADETEAVAADKYFVKKAFVVTLMQRMKVEYDTRDAKSEDKKARGLGLEDKDLEELLITSALSSDAYDAAFMEQFKREYVNKAGISAADVGPAAKEQAKKLGLEKGKTASATIYELLMTYADRKMNMNVDRNMGKIDAEAVMAILRAA
ncbi:MAG: hypothetical protein LBL00_09295 [Endomicrobium sp.]|jgi:phosphomannomutase|nr:hypothetical protein [Endomicrobium sp.]